MFGRFAEAAGTPVEPDAVYATLFAEALASDADAGGLLAYNYLAGEPVTGVDDGRPLLVRTPDSRFTLGNLVRAEVYGAFATLSIGMEVLADEDVERRAPPGPRRSLPHAAAPPSSLLAAALRVPVAVESTASEGGAWGVAVLAAYLRVASQSSLAEFLNDEVFGSAEAVVEEPRDADLAGFATYLERYRAALPLQRAAAGATPTTSTESADS